MLYMKVRLKLKREMLGTCASDPEIFTQFIASKAEDPERAKAQIEQIKNSNAVNDEGDFVDPEEAVKGITIYPKNEDNGPLLMDYQIKGFFKAACSALRLCKTDELGQRSAAIKNYKKQIDDLIHVRPLEWLEMREDDDAEDLCFIPIVIPEGEKMGICSRPLRAQTMKGERVSIAISETCPVGSEMTFIIECRNEDLRDTIEDWLKYGKDKGLLQWRNAGKGRFSYHILDEWYENSTKFANGVHTNGDEKVKIGKQIKKKAKGDKEEEE